MIPIVRERVPSLSTSVTITPSQAAQMTGGTEPTLGTFQSFLNYIINLIARLLGGEPRAGQEELHSIYQALNPGHDHDQVDAGAGRSSFTDFLESTCRLIDITQEEAQQHYHFRVEEAGSPREHRLMFCHDGESMGGVLIGDPERAFLIEYCCDPARAEGNRHYPESAAKLRNVHVWGVYCKLFAAANEMQFHGEWITRPPPNNISQQQEVLAKFEYHREAVRYGLTDMLLSPNEITLKALIEQIKTGDVCYQQYITECRQINIKTFDEMLAEVIGALQDPKITERELRRIQREFKQFYCCGCSMETFDANKRPYALEFGTDIEFACHCKVLYEQIIQGDRKSVALEELMKEIEKINNELLKKAFKETHIELLRATESEIVVLTDYFDPEKDYGHLQPEDAENLTYLTVGLNKKELGCYCLPGNFAAKLQDLEQRGKEKTLEKQYRKELKKELEKVIAQIEAFCLSSLAYLEKLVAEVGITPKDNQVDPPLCQWIEDMAVGVTTWPEGKHKQKAEKIIDQARKMIDKHNNQAAMQQALA